ncbi:MAG: glycosyltransferase family 4 protein [Actinomycetota bacterium]|nr:glycosyltransferase family 4 protein [Actinomycetota bacterium]
MSRKTAVVSPAEGMNVVFIALGIYGAEGGMERFNRRVLRSLSELKSSNHVMASVAIALWDGRSDLDLAPVGVDLIACERKKLRALFAFVRRIWKAKPTVVLYGHLMLTPLSLLVRFLSPRSRQILFAHGYEVWDPPSLFMKWVIRRRIDSVGAVSRYTIERMSEAYRLPRPRFVELMNAVDVDDTEVSPASLDLEGEFNLLTVSRLNRLDRDKHVDKVILALPLVLQRFPETHLYVVGEGDLRTELEGLVAVQRLTAHVHLMGKIDDTTRETLYERCDAFVLPSTQEGFGIVYLEAWMHRMPVIAGKGGAAPEVVRHGVDGLVVEPDTEAIANAVCSLQTDPLMSPRLGQAGYERAKNHFNHNRFRALLARLLGLVVQ